MKKSEDVKEKIINTTTDLIINGNGNINDITTRVIAEKANIGIGLVNYHFQTKENLIEICVQRIISKVILEFKPELDKNLSSTGRLKIVSKLVTDFLMENQSVARISILGDINSPSIKDNTAKTIMGFSHALIDNKLPDKEKQVFMFVLTTVLQSAFLRKEISLELFGYDFNDKKQRDLLIDFIIDRFIKGGNDYE